MWLDVVLTLPILWGVYNGYQKGLISQVLGIISLAIGIYMGIPVSYTHLTLPTIDRV